MAAEAAAPSSFALGLAVSSAAAAPTRLASPSSSVLLGGSQPQRPPRNGGGNGSEASRTLRQLRLRSGVSQPVAAGLRGGGKAGRARNSRLPGCTTHAEGRARRRSAQASQRAPADPRDPAHYDKGRKAALPLSGLLARPAREARDRPPVGPLKGPRPRALRRSLDRLGAAPGAAAALWAPELRRGASALLRAGEGLSLRPSSPSLYGAGPWFGGVFLPFRPLRGLGRGGSWPPLPSEEAHPLPAAEVAPLPLPRDSPARRAWSPLCSGSGALAGVSAVAHPISPSRLGAPLRAPSERGASPADRRRAGSQSSVEARRCTLRLRSLLGTGVSIDGGGSSS